MMDGRLNRTLLTPKPNEPRTHTHTLFRARRSLAVSPAAAATMVTAAAKLDPERAAESNSILFMVIVCVFASFALITASLRFYTRAILVRSFGKDDVLMVLAVIGGLSAWILGCRNGYGRHQDTIDRPQFIILLEAQFVQSVVEASFAFGFLKISIALSLLRLSRSKWYKWIIWGLVAFTCIYTLFSFMTFMTFCAPVSANWDRSGTYKCYGKELYRDFGLFNASCNILTDVAFATLPIPLIWSLQLQRRIRIYLIAILSGGYFAVALGVAKAVFIIAFVGEKDGTFYPWAPFFGSLQLDLGIIAACAPTLRPLLGSFLRLSNHLNHYKEANYYRAGKALAQLPRGSGGNSARGYLKQNTASGEFAEMVRAKSRSQGAAWASVGMMPHRAGETINGTYSATVESNAAPAHQGSAGKGLSVSASREKPIVEEVETGSMSDEITIIQMNDLEYGARGIVKTTEYKVEK
ncbi:hypothetical protein B0T22DRAFT_515877 [Podospora appendiculata]|uniref:Rhodopsin domain-containing protein n=1 Tax=Podospora appendiculata TaxID=314037 RepID=A0AAE0XDB2_9PEZI|nr:hypothetical protein B0T22DRAFT_515877 [Podospora appendiculata]